MTCLCHIRDDFYKDILRFDTLLQRWDSGFDPVPLAQGRAYHAATVLGSKIWLTGGSSSRDVFSNILVFDTLTLQWERVTIRCHVWPVHLMVALYAVQRSISRCISAHLTASW